jgi:hypothetical protein
MNPETATDAEVSAWLAEHCMGWHIITVPLTIAGQKDDAQMGMYSDYTGENQSSESIMRVEDFHPTSDYDQLVMCEDKVRDRWTIGLQQEDTLKHEDEQFYAYASVEGDIRFDLYFRNELSARCRLIVMILLWEKKHACRA